jgi:AraC family transcriptional regulator
MRPKKEETIREYTLRMNKVINYISSNLDKNLSLEDLANISCFSKFHFHRIFTEFMGEPVNNFIRRLRLQKAAQMLAFDRYKSITDIGFDCGFSSTQNFSKTFNIHFSISPSTLRKSIDYNDLESSRRKIGKLNSKIGKALEKHSCYNSGITETPDILIQTKKRSSTSINVELRDISDYLVAYVRHIGEYDLTHIRSAFEKIFLWAKSRDLINKKTVALGVCWDDPVITPIKQCRYDACIPIPEEIPTDGSIGIQKLQGGTTAVYHCVIEDNNFEEPWAKLMGEWLPWSGYQPDNRPYYSILYNIAEGDAQSAWTVDFCLPVKPL